MADAFSMAERYLRENPQLREALDVLRVSEEQYARAQQALAQPSVQVTNSSHPSTEDEELERDR